MCDPTPPDWFARHPVLSAVGFVALVVALSVGVYHGIRAAFPILGPHETTPGLAESGNELDRFRAVGAQLLPDREAELERYRERLRANGTAVQKDCVNGVFECGEPVEKVLAAHRPDFRITMADVGVLVYRPAEPAARRGRTLIVVAKDGKLFGALTRAVIGPGEERPMNLLIPGSSFLDPRPEDIAFWEQLEPIDGPSAAVAGGPVVVGRLLCAGWWPE